MSSLLSRIKDAWLVLTGKETISPQEHEKSLTVKGRLSKYRTVTVSSFGPAAVLNSGEIPLRMMSFESLELGRIDTSFVSAANFMAPLIGDKDSRRMLLTVEGIVIEGIFICNFLNAVSISCKDQPVFTAEVLIEIPEYQMVRGS